MKRSNENYSYQSALFAYLTEEQQMEVRPILRMLKKWVQDELCCALLDYIEMGEEANYDNLLLDCAFCYLTCPNVNGDNKGAIINPKKQL